MIDLTISGIISSFGDERAQTAFEIVGLNIGFFIIYEEAIKCEEGYVYPINFVFEVYAGNMIDKYIKDVYDLYLTEPCVHYNKTFFTTRMNKQKEEMDRFICDCIGEALIDIINPFVYERIEEISTVMNNKYSKHICSETLKRPSRVDYTELNQIFIDYCNQNVEIKEKVINGLEKAYIDIYYSIWSTKNHLLKFDLIELEKTSAEKISKGISVLEVCDKECVDVFGCKLDNVGITSVLMIYRN